MYGPAFQMLLADARINDLRRARATLIQPHRSRDGRNRRPAARWGLLRRAGIGRLVSADPSRAN